MGHPPTSYTYDSLNRLTGKSYSDGTPSVQLQYDTNGMANWPPGLSEGNFAGRLSRAVEWAGSQIVFATDPLGYDQMGRSEGNASCLFQEDCSYAGSYDSPFSLEAQYYDAAGDLYSLASEYAVNNASSIETGEQFYYDATDRLDLVEGSVALPPFTTGWATPLFSNGGYNAAGQLTSAGIGPSLIGQTRTYDKRLRILSEEDLNANQQTLYSYTIPSGTGYAPNGNLLSFDDSVIGQWSMASNGTPCYDHTNRITCASATTSAGPYSGLNVGWTYDAFGNRTAQNTSGTPSAPVPPSEYATYGTNNQITSATSSPGGFGYDAAGNVTNDGVNAYYYDAEDRPCAVYSSASGTVTEYLYDALGNRVMKGTLANATLPLTAADCQFYQNYWSGALTPTNWYVLDNDATPVDEYNVVTGTLMHSDAYANGRLVATFSPSLSNWTYPLSDWLGTKRVVANADGSMGENCYSLPFGDALDCTGGPDPSEHHFTGKMRDTETGNDYFGARYYNSMTGRFLTPDWSDDPDDAVPYANTGDPQSLNLYAYVQNNLLNLTDLDGHQPLDMPSLTCPTGNHCQVLSNAQEQEDRGNAKQTAGGRKPYTIRVNVRLVLDPFDPAWMAGLMRWSVRHPKIVYPIIEGLTAVSAIFDEGASLEAIPEEEAGEAAAAEAGEATSESAQMKRLSNGEIEKLKEHGIDPHDLKPNSKYDLFKNKDGDIFVKPKAGNGPGDPTGINIKDF